ncbi:MAG: transporter substrate-binding domain-containing protein [bacterium]|nr:transporter substrate-binding domain-containing protein [bacterium]MDT8367318.1 transporter substrate-binding domain-containing protein [bacterium]
MKRFTIATACILSVCLLALPVFAADNSLAEKSTLHSILKSGKLRVGMEPGYMPFEMQNKESKVVGFDVDMAKLMAREMGVELELVPTGWDAIIGSLLTDKFDIIMSGMTVTQQRNLKVNFADPYIIVGQTILLSKKLEGTVKSYKDLNDKKYTVTSKLGTTGEQAVKKNIPRANYKSFETEPEAALEVINGKADAFVYDLPYCVVFYAQKGAGKLVFLDEPFTFEPLGWAIKQGDPDFLNWLNNFLAQARGDGRYDKIYQRWITGTDWIRDVQ